MSGPELRPLCRREVRWLYRWEMKAAFPRAERRSLGLILSMMARGNYQGWGLFRGGEVLGYAFVRLGPSYVLLDYLGVCQGKRDQGLGSALLRALQERYAGSAGMLAEVEAPEEARTPEEAGRRARRVAFYRRNGFTPLDYEADLFTVRYAMLGWSPSGRLEREEAMAAHAAFYRGELPAAVCRRWVHIPAGPEA